MHSKESTFSLSQLAWDTWCIGSVIGIWPRFIEPRLLLTTHLTLAIPQLPHALQGLRIAHFSDLHLTSKSSTYLLQKLIRKTKALKPDLILFSGDFINYGHLEDGKGLQQFLAQLQAPFGCYAVAGNHDYQHYIALADSGDYDAVDSPASSLKKGLSRLFKKQFISGKTTPKAYQLPINSSLKEVLRKTPFQLLHNETHVIDIKGSKLNITGLGEYSAGWTLPEKAFENFNTSFPGIVLSHNPDSLPLLKSFPGDIILCGHTHGGQINLPGLVGKFTILENPQFKRGLHQIGTKTAYISRGIGGAMKFRWFSPPELLLITLKGA